MATKSILKDIEFKEKKLAKKFLLALENAEGKTSKTVTYSKVVNDVRREQIDRLFAGKQ